MRIVLPIGAFGPDNGNNTAIVRDLSWSVVADSDVP